MVDTTSDLIANRAARLKLTSSSIEVGSSSPLGATVRSDGVNFSVYSKNATLVELLLFDSVDAIQASRVITLDPREHRTYHYWHVFIPELTPGQVYGFRAIGPFDPERGLRFDGDKLLLDPYAGAVALPKTYSRTGNSIACAMKSIVGDPLLYDWEGDQPIQRSFVETVIYEMHALASPGILTRAWRPKGRVPMPA
jgi:isoamylase